MSNRGGASPSPVAMEPGSCRRPGEKIIIIMIRSVVIMYVRVVSGSYMGHLTLKVELPWTPSQSDRQRTFNPRAEMPRGVRFPGRSPNIHVYVVSMCTGGMDGNL